MCTVDVSSCTVQHLNSARVQARTRLTYISIVSILQGGMCFQCAALLDCNIMFCFLPNMFQFCPMRLRMLYLVFIPTQVLSSGSSWASESVGARQHELDQLV